jgi:hypothetical protein
MNIHRKTTFILLAAATAIGLAGFHKPTREDVIRPCLKTDSPMTPPCRLKNKGFKGVSPLHPVPDIRGLLT